MDCTQPLFFSSKTVILTLGRKVNALHGIGSFVVTGQKLQNTLLSDNLSCSFLGGGGGGVQIFSAYVHL